MKSGRTFDLSSTCIIYHMTNLWLITFSHCLGAVGAIDCFHVEIEKPAGAWGNEFINRKGWASINVQATVNADEWFTSVDCRWPGATHDSRILIRNSEIIHLLEMWSVLNRNPILLADSGYSGAPWIATPYKFNNANDLLPHCRLYNKLFCKERVIVERCFGQVERRFPLIAGRMRLNLNNIPPTVVACMILHNCAKFRRDTGDFGQF